jgi:hypothetical protein
MVWVPFVLREGYEAARKFPFFLLIIDGMMAKM